MDKENLLPREVICVLPLRFKTLMDGDVFMFLIMDVATNFVYQADVEKGEGIENVLTQLKSLMKNKDFNIHKTRPFTLVMTKHEEHRTLIEDIIKPKKGSLLIDEQYVIQNTAHAANHLLSSIKARRNS